MKFDDELLALRRVYEALQPFEIHERDRIVRLVQERLARERPGSRVLSLAARTRTGA